MIKLIKITLAILLLIQMPISVIEKVFYSNYTEETYLAKYIVGFPEYSKIDITITRYYPSESSNCTGSMLCTNKFEINAKGWYTYQGKVVVAAATRLCQTHCANRASYGEFPSDYRIYDFYDEIQFVIENVIYTGIVLDSCGACMYHINGEKLQRYDIFVSTGLSSLLSTGNAGKIQAQLIQNAD